MPGIINGYEYDIFISYRHNDDKYDNWVTEFVANLNRELESTIKEKVTIYIDRNPQDGLLETHNVDKSLSSKLNSLIFIPILSQTYCDPNSYAWQNEFLTFNQLIKKDHLNNEIKLRNGNVTGRILPIRIHELDTEDLIILKEELGSQLRAIDFVYKEPGVNRPLRPDDNEDKNLNKTKYRNQLNKVANSVKEILVSVQNGGKPGIKISDDLYNWSEPSPKSIAVLPFVNMSNDPDQEYFSDGISEEIINTLAQIPGLKVAGRTSAFSFRNKDEDIRFIGEKLNVSNILEGSVRKSGNRIRITAQLVEASSGFHIWSEKFDRELVDIFIIQDEIARAIVGHLKIALGGYPLMPRERVHSQNVEAYELYLKGMSFFYKRGLHMFDGLKCFEDALEIDPDYALALSGLADSYTMLCLHSYMAPEEAWPKAAAAAKRALLFGTDLAEVHSSLAVIAMLFERDWVTAEAEFLLSLKQNPRYLQARSWYAVFYLLVVKSDLKEALTHAHIGVDSDPLSSYAQTIVSAISSLDGNHAEGIASGQRAVEFDPESFSAWFFLGYSNHCVGNLSSAIEAYNQAIDISGRHIWALTSLLVLLNEPSEYQNVIKANFIYKELLTRERTGYVSPFLLAAASAALGKNEEAIRYVKQGLDRHDPLFTNVSPGRPESKALRAIPEFCNLMESIGLY